MSSARAQRQVWEQPGPCPMHPCPRHPCLVHFLRSQGPAQLPTVPCGHGLLLALVWLVPAPNPLPSSAPTGHPSGFPKPASCGSDAWKDIWWPLGEQPLLSPVNRVLLLFPQAMAV